MAETVARDDLDDGGGAGDGHIVLHALHARQLHQRHGANSDLSSNCASHQGRQDGEPPFASASQAVVIHVGGGGDGGGGGGGGEGGICGGGGDGSGGCGEGGAASHQGAMLPAVVGVQL